MSVLSLVWLAASLSLLLGGAVVLARGAARLSDAAGFSTRIRGLVPIAFAASLPEIMLAARATGRTIDLPDLALGDIVGSVIANYLLALAVGALALPLVISPRLLRFAFPLAIVLSLAMLAAAWTGVIAPAIGGCLAFAAVLWPLVAVAIERLNTRPARKARKDQPKRTSPKPSQSSDPSRSWRIHLINAFWCAVGAGAIYFGSQPLLTTSPKLASLTSLDEVTFGLTVIAFVTTLPEAILCLVATLRGERETAPAIVVGSSLFNLTAALGLATLRSSEELLVPPIIFELALPIAIAAGLACVPPFVGMNSLSRLSGLALFAFYVGFLVYAIVGESLYPAKDPDAAQQIRFYAMFLLAMGLIAVLSLIAIVERLVQKARLADD